MTSPSRLPRKVLLALLLAVVLAHLLVLHSVPWSTGLDAQAADTNATLTFTTRTVVPQPVAAPVVALPAPVRVSPRPPRAAPGAALAALAPSATAAPAPPQVEAAVPVLPEPLPDEAPNPPEVPAAEPDTPVAQATPSPPTAAADVLSPLAPAKKVADSVRLRYTVQANKFPFSLQGELLWQHDGAQYETRLSYSAFGQSRTQTSQGELSAQGLAPTRFSDKFRSEVAAHFNREKNLVTFSANTPDVALQAGAQDRLSVLIQLGALIASAPARYPTASTVTLQTVGPRDAATWQFTVQAQETLSLPGGDLATVKLVRNPRQEYDQTVELWLAPALGYLPARIRITEHNGDFIDQQWRDSTPPP